MKLADVSIRRPVFATMMMAALVVFGVVLYLRLNVDLYPEVDFPIVTVTVPYPGADPGTMEEQVADPLEEEINSLSGIRSLRSTSLESVTQVFVEFDLDKDLDTATQDVRDRVSAVQPDLPDGAEAPIVEKLDLGAAPIMRLAVSGSTDEVTLSRWAEDELKPSLERLGGVGQVELVGSRDREMHVWLDPGALRSLGLTTGDVVDALRAQNLDLPGGRVTEGDKELVIRTEAEATSAAQLARIAVATIEGTPVRLEDVARVEDGLEERRSVARVDDRPAIAVVIRKQSDANTVEVADAVTAALPDIDEEAPPGTEIEVLLDNSTEIRSSIETVQLDLVLGALLAVAIIFVFLRDPRATFISALALPTSVIGTFGFIAAMGFTLNMMTTLALSLSIGILIDDAIVVIENIVRRRTQYGEAPVEAASRGVAEIGLAVLAVTLSIVAVFVPVAFMEGMIGQFFYEFGLTVAFAVLLSLFVSFTLTPMLSARFLAPHHGPPKGLSGLVERALGALDSGYRRVVAWALRHRWMTLGGAVGALVATFAIAPLVGFEFVPIQDRGQFVAKLELPPGTSLGTTSKQALEVAGAIREMPGVESTFTTVGGGAQERVNTAEIVVSLIGRDRRAFHQTDAMAHVRDVVGRWPEMRASVEEVTAVSGGGTRNAPVHLNIRGSDLQQMETAANAIAEELRSRGGYVDVDTTYRSGKPQLDVTLDRARAEDVGVAAVQVARTVRTLAAGTVASRVQDEGERYDVRVQLPPGRRQSVETIARAEVRTPSGERVEIGQVADVARTRGPSQIDREARQRQITVYANLEEKPLGDAMTEVEEIARAETPAGVGYAFGGSSKMLEESMASMLLALFLAIVCVYMILAAQFESFVHPFTIMMSLPFSLIGAFGGLLATGSSMSIFAMIGLIMLMGLVTKNAILLVDFAIQRRAEGEELNEALENAGAIRLRPILMTTAAMIFGMLPVAIGHGSGGEIRAPMGITVIGGLVTSTVLTLVVVPVIYALVEAVTGWVRRKLGRAQSTAQASTANEGAEASP